MNKAKSFEELIVWRKSHQLVLEVYRMTQGFPEHELFGLTSQMRRSAVSIPANIVEGFKRKGTRDKSRFYNIAQASLEELRYYLILARDLGYSDIQTMAIAAEEVSRILDSYAGRLKAVMIRSAALCILTTAVFGYGFLQYAF